MTDKLKKSRQKARARRKIITPEMEFNAQELCRGVGPKDPKISHFGRERKARLNAAVKDACKQYGCHPRELQWRMDKSGIIQIKKKPSVRLKW